MTNREKEWYKPYRNYWNKHLKNSKRLQSLNEELENDFNNLSLNLIDNFLKKNYKEITCSELAAIYFKFFLDLKNIKSNSGNFVGFSEFLILRTLLHVVNEEYYPMDKIQCNPKPIDPKKPEGKKNPNIGYFSFGNNNDLIVSTESIEKDFCKKKKRPDIILYRNNWQQLIGIVSVKACEVSKTYIKNEIKFLKDLKEENKEKGEVKGLIVVFAKTKFKEKETVHQLWGDPEIHPKHNSKPISEVLRKELNLDVLNN